MLIFTKKKNRLSELGQQVGSRVLDVLVLREKGMKREVRVLNILLFIKSVLWKVSKKYPNSKSDKNGSQTNITQMEVIT